jgi:hypothetical protein
MGERAETRKDRLGGRTCASSCAQDRGGRPQMAAARPTRAAPSSMAVVAFPTSSSPMASIPTQRWLRANNWSNRMWIESAASALVVEIWAEEAVPRRHRPRGRGRGGGCHAPTRRHYPQPDTPSSRPAGRPEAATPDGEKPWWRLGF